MKKILGLDLGTSSIGWALVNEAETSEEKSSIIKLGVRVNPLTVDELQNFEKGKSITTNADRTAGRSMRRNLQRYKLRRENLIEVLKEYNFIRYKFTPRWKMSLLGSLDESEGGLKDIYPFRYREDYRTVVKHTGKVPVTVRQLYTCYLEYKNTIKEFFWTLSASYSHNRYNLITERNYKDGNFYLSSVERNHSSHSYTLNTIGSKGIYDWNLKTSLELTLARNEGKQLNEGIVQDYRYDYLCIEPKIVWAPSVFFEAEYKATVSCVGGGIGEDTSLDPLWEVAQRLTLSLEFHDTEFRLSGEHFYNDLSKNQHLNIWLADVSLIHKAGKWRFAASAINLFNKEQYRYTLYSAVQSYTSWIKLRPREFMVSVQYQW